MSVDGRVRVRVIAFNVWGGRFLLIRRKIYLVVRNCRYEIGFISK